jgi:hypothetical protein
MLPRMRRSQLLAAALLIVATPLATWWVVGDVSEDAPPAALSYSFDPPPLGSAASLVLGAGATVVAVVSLTLLGSATWRNTLDRVWWLVLLPLVALGVFAGWSYRVMTAGIIGANIGAGFVILALPVAAVSSVTTALTGWHVRVRGARRPSRGVAQLADVDAETRS